jgi:hypothetical protein
MGGAGGVVVVAWGTTKVAGTTRGVAEVNEAHDEEGTKGQAVRPPRVMV